MKCWRPFLAISDTLFIRTWRDLSGGRRTISCPIYGTADILDTQHRALLSTPTCPMLIFCPRVVRRMTSCIIYLSIPSFYSFLLLLPPTPATTDSRMTGCLAPPRSDAKRAHHRASDGISRSAGGVRTQETGELGKSREVYALINMITRPLSHLFCASLFCCLVG